MYAVIASGGKQYRVAEGETLRVEKLAGPEGTKVTLVPAGPVSFSTRRVSPSLTRYCFPPEEMTAYIAVPEASEGAA